MATDIAGALAVVEAFNEGRISRTQSRELLSAVDNFGPGRVSEVLDSVPERQDRDSIVCSDRVKLAMIEGWDTAKSITAVYGDGDREMVMHMDSAGNVEFDWPSGVGVGRTGVSFEASQFQVVSELMDVARQYMDGKS